MKKLNRSAFTLVEIMIVVAIIALLAAIAIPNLLRARLTANDSVAQATLKAMATAAETYASANSGQYPGDMNSMTTAVPPFISTNWVTRGPFSGYTFGAGIMGVTGYAFDATPVTVGTTGTRSYTISTGALTTGF